MTKDRERFADNLKIILKYEGGYSNRKSDRGGETNYGITHSTYDAYRRSKGLVVQSVRFIENREIEDIYYSLYWMKSHCNLLPDKLALCNFDWAVNAGVHRAITTLQKVINTPPDGIFGVNSNLALSNALKQRGEILLCSSYLNLREHYYMKWGVGDQRVNLAGWINRLNSLRAKVL